MLSWPSKSFKALVKLFEPLQDVDVYVEDAKDEVFYKQLLTRLAGEEVRICRVFAPPDQGGKGVVVGMAAAHDQSKRRAVFIIDGDLPFARGDQMAEKIPGLVRLEAYCIENYLMCPDAASRLLMEERILAREDAEAQLDFQAWRQSVQAPLVKLFAWFSLINDLLPTYATVSVGVGVYCDQIGKATQLSPSKVEQAIANVRGVALSVAPVEQVEERVEMILRRAEELPDPLAIVSGKDFLLPLLMFRLSALGCKLSKDRLRFRLALHCSTYGLLPLLATMKEVAQGIHVPA